MASRRGPYSGHLDRAEPLVNPIREGSGFVFEEKAAFEVWRERNGS
jgi:hypothetical protein